MERRDRAISLIARHQGRAAEDILADVITTEFEGRIGLVSSFGTEAAVLLHMVSRIDPYVPVIFLDTQKHFPETLAYRDALVAHLGLCNIQVVSPRPASLEAEDPYGRLHAVNPDLCCHVRKTLPMLAALRNLECWITGRKRGQASTRATLELVEVQDRWFKINPLLNWSSMDVEAYFRAHELPEHPLKHRDFPSVGCAPCTEPVARNADPRSGRWAGSDKTECGIHFENGRVARR